jgi:Cys-tRNA(Pro) deacylase
MGPTVISGTLDRDTPALLPVDADVLEGHPAVQAIAQWATSYLCAPHPELGRSGPVCPFVPGALVKKLIFATVYEDTDLDVSAIKAILLSEMERFIALDPVSGNEAQFKALMVLFPELPADRAADLIETAQAELQGSFVPNGLMVGEFHSGPPDKRGLWNPEFRPLYSPVPMLAIRHMVPTDVLFLKDSAPLFREYIKIYGNAVPERFRSHFEEAAERFGMTTHSGSNAQAAPRIVDALDAAGIAHEAHCHDHFDRPIRAPKDFADALGYELARITKTLFLRSRDEDRHYLVVCSMDKRVDLPGLAARLGTRRLEMASLADLQRLVGYPPTSVTPIAVDDIPVFMDETLLRHPTVLTGAGVPRVEIEISPSDLAALCNAQTVCIA